MLPYPDYSPIIVLAQYRVAPFLINPPLAGWCHLLVAYVDVQLKGSKRVQDRESPPASSARAEDPVPNLDDGGNGSGGNSNNVRGGFAETARWMDLFKGVYSEADTMARGRQGRRGGGKEASGSFPYPEVYGRHLRPVLTPWRDETPNGR
ncbi:hypothetical protein KM043_013645 [Ampulex compressa]|nr:hypothetical protein KM043_013645 [Ampulex compressa]